MPDHLPKQEGVNFNINQAKTLVTTAGGTAEAVAKQFLLDHPSSSKFLAAHSNQELAMRVIQSTLPLLHAFDEMNACSDHEKQTVYLQFVATLTDLAKAPGDFSKQLREKNVMETVYESIGKIIYNRAALADQIKPSVEAHLAFMKTAWSSPGLQFKQQTTLRKS